MGTNNFIYIFLAAYLATFLRLTINNNFFISIIGSFLVGFFISKRLSYSMKKILLSGFLSCFTSFSGFIYFLYKILDQGDWIKFIIFFNLIIIANLFTMLFGFLISRKLNYSNEKILLSGFFSCFTSFSGFIYFLYKILNQGDWIKFIVFFNLIILINIFIMYFGFWVSRKII